MNNEQYATAINKKIPSFQPQGEIPVKIAKSSDKEK